MIGRNWCGCGSDGDEETKSEDASLQARWRCWQIEITSQGEGWRARHLRCLSQEAPFRCMNASV